MAQWVLIKPNQVLVMVYTSYCIDFISAPPSVGGGKCTPTPYDPVQQAALNDEIHALVQKGTISDPSSSWLSRKEQGWVLATHTEPETTEQGLCLPKTFSNGDPICNYPLPLRSICGWRLSTWRTTSDISFSALNYQGVDFKFTALLFRLSTSPMVLIGGRSYGHWVEIHQAMCIPGWLGHSQRPLRRSDKKCGNDYGPPTRPRLVVNVQNPTSHSHRLSSSSGMTLGFTTDSMARTLFSVADFRQAVATLLEHSHLVLAVLQTPPSAMGVAKLNG